MVQVPKYNNYLTKKKAPYINHKKIISKNKK